MISLQTGLSGDEHDRYEWVQPEELTRCLPAWVSLVYAEVLGRLGLAT